MYPLTLSLKKDNIQNILTPINYVTEQCILTIKPEEIYTITGNESVILYAKIKAQNSVTDSINLNIGNVSNFKYLFGLIKEDQFDTIVEKNNISYKSDTIRFKYHLFEEGIIKKATVSLDKVNSFVGDTSFSINSKVIQELTKFNAAINSEKIYIFTCDNKVCAEITDKSVQNTDSITMVISDSFTGNDIKQPISVSLEVLRNISLLRYNWDVTYNSSYKVVAFDTTSEDLTLKYIVTTYTK